MRSYETFRKLMYEKDVRKADVIRGTGVSRPTILKWENGELPTLPILRKIARYFDVPVKTFIEEDEQ